MKKCMPIYYKLTGGHGAGAETVMEAEAEYMHGNIENAEILCHKSMIEAEVRMQSSIYQSALFILAKIYISMGKKEEYLHMIDNVVEKSNENFEDLCRYTTDLVLGSLGCILEDFDYINEWLIEGNSLSRRKREIAALAKERLSIKEISSQLFISESTVKNTLSRVYEKLEIHSRNELKNKEF